LAEEGDEGSPDGTSVMEKPAEKVLLGWGMGEHQTELELW